IPAGQGRYAPRRNLPQTTVAFALAPPQNGAGLRTGLISQAPPTMASTMRPGMMASQVPVAAKAPVPAQPIDDSASEKVARRDETWRRRKRLRLAWARNQNWIAVAEPAATAMPPDATSAANGVKSASTTTNGPKIIAIPPSTASTLARRTRARVTGADAISSGASSPDTASQARPPPNCPAAMIKTGTKSEDAPPPS